MYWLTHWYWILILATLAVPVVINFVFKFIVAPIRLHARRGPQRKPRWEPTDVEHLSAETREFVGRLVRDFVVEGFEVAANVTHPLQKGR